MACGNCGGCSGVGCGRTTRVERLPELWAEEAERAAYFAECAIVQVCDALLVAQGHPKGVVDAISRGTDTLDALDQELGTNEHYLGIELREQREDFTVLRAVERVGPREVDQLRERAVRVGATVEDVVRRLLAG